MIEQYTSVRFNEKVAHETFLMGLESPEISREAEPGHFVMIRVSEGTDPLLRRPFSICSVEGDSLFLILYRVVGQGTSIMSRAGKGDRLSVLGPLGKGFEMPQSGEVPILVSGGIGIAPIIFLAQRLGSRKALLMAGYRTSDEIVDKKACGLIEVQISIATDDGTSGHPGFVTDLLEDHLDGNKKETPSVFACGPAPMLKTIAALTQSRGIPCQVSLESLMACGVGACQGCAVRAASAEERAYLHVCEDGPVFHSECMMTPFYLE
jgi:dihydroorotate dehydrogenase electron transfer subunit